MQCEQRANYSLDYHLPISIHQFINTDDKCGDHVLRTRLVFATYQEGVEKCFR